MCPSRSRRWPIRDDNGPHSTFVGVRGRHCRFLSHVLDFARAEIPNDVLILLKMESLFCGNRTGRSVASSSETSCVDWSRGRLFQQVVLAVEEATAPFQYALSTKGGGECVAHAIQSLTELDPRATVLSVDGIGAFDLIARAAMLDGLLNVDGGDSVLPFVLQFCSEPSQHLWEDDTETLISLSKARAVSRETRWATLRSLICAVFPSSR